MVSKRNENWFEEPAEDAGVVVLKFGSSVLADDGDLPSAVHEIYRHVRAGRKVVAVVSALGGMTDALLARAKRLEADAGSEFLAALLATGEEQSVALLCLALERAGLPVSRFDAASAGLDTEGSLCDSRPVGLDVGALRAALRARPVAVLPGFVGRAADGRISLLGRGGSDYTALFVAQRLGARCRLVKDVDGLYERDPSAGGPAPRRFDRVSWDKALEIDGGVVQPKAIRFAREHGLAFELGALGARGATVVGPGPESVAREQREPQRPLRVGLLGLGTVGLGVYRSLLARPDLYEPVRALVRDPEKHSEVPREFLTADPEDVLAEDCDLIVELIGGTDLAPRLIRAALERGVPVVTANKAAMAEQGRELLAVAERNGVELLFGASVGGGMPALEAVRRLARREELSGFEGVLNGTVNFVLDEVGRGVAFDDAVKRAQELGFAEADPTMDLDGTDAAQKLELLAREAFPGCGELLWLNREGVLGLDGNEVLADRAEGRVTRLVASCFRSEAGVVASLRVLSLPPGHPLCEAHGERNALLVHLADGRGVHVAGKGAGRWPTAEAVMGDVYQLARAAGRAGRERDGRIAI